MIIVLMGVSGSGKTFVGKRLASELGWRFYDGDDYHPPANIDKMAGGVPLTDRDREPWLAELRKLILECQARGEQAVLACSALKQAYRDTLKREGEDIRLVHLRGDYACIRQRLGKREGHFMKAAMLQSQFAVLEASDDIIEVETCDKPETVIQAIREALGV